MNRDEYAQMFRLEDRHFWFTARRDLLVRALTQFPPPLPPSSITGAQSERPLFLDVGCGTGGTLDKLAALGTVVGVDVEPLALQFCQERGHTHLACASATRLPFAPNTFSAVIALDVVEHIADDKSAVSEICRVLAPGGLLFLTVPAYQGLWSGHDVALMHQRRYVARQMRGLLHEAGFEIPHLTYTVSALLPPVWLWRGLQKRFTRPGTPPRADAAVTPEPINGLLRGLLSWEGRLSLRAPMPFGLTVFAIARKPIGSPAPTQATLATQATFAQ